MPAYDSAAYHPPAPIAFVTVRSSDGTVVANVPMLLDSGADVSLLPRGPITALIASANAATQFELEGFDGTRSFAPVFNFELELLGKKFRGQYLVVDANHGIIGRNILNSLSILLDGPSLSWKVSR